MTKYNTSAINEAYWGLNENTLFLKGILDFLNKEAGEVIEEYEFEKKSAEEISAAFGTDIAELTQPKPTLQMEDVLAIIDRRVRFVMGLQNFIDFLISEISDAEWVADMKLTPADDSLRISIMTKRHGIYWLVLNRFGIWFTNKNQYAKAVQELDKTHQIVRFEIGQVEAIEVVPIQYGDTFAYAFVKYIQQQFLKNNPQDTEEEEPEW